MKFERSEPRLYITLQPPQLQVLVGNFVFSDSDSLSIGNSFERFRYSFLVIGICVLLTVWDSDFSPLQVQTFKGKVFKEKVVLK